MLNQTIFKVEPMCFAYLLVSRIMFNIRAIVCTIHTYVDLHLTLDWHEHICVRRIKIIHPAWTLILGNIPETFIDRSHTSTRNQIRLNKV